MNGEYLLEEQLDISFEAVGYYGKRKKDGKRPSFKFNAYIVYIQNDLVMYSIISEQDDVAQKKLLEAFKKPIKKNDYRIINSYIGDANNSVDLRFSEEIRFTQHAFISDQEAVAMSLKQIKFSYKEQSNGIICRLSSVCSSIFFGPLEHLMNDEDFMTWKNNSNLDKQCFGKPFALSKKGNHVYIKTTQIDSILSVFSFYFCTHFECDMISTPEQNGTVSIQIKAPRYKTTSGNSLKTIGYLLLRQTSLGSFKGFLSSTKDCNGELWNDQLSEGYISSFIRAEYLDEISKLIIYTTILEKMASGSKKMDTYRCIRDFLAQKKIDISKIDNNIGDRNIKIENGDTISNFIQLRNFFVHHLGSEEAELFLRNSDMLFNLKLTITILLLYGFGFSEIRFKPEFAHLSVFDECIKLGKMRKVKSQKCRLCKWIRRIINIIRLQ